MAKRIKIDLIEPKFYEMLVAIDKHIANSGLTTIQIDILKIRASQLNWCAYCIQSYTKDARAHGETEERIYALDFWEASPYFTDEERAILALTDEMTLIRDKRVSDQTYEQVVALFGEKLTAYIIMAIISVNAWIRISIATRMTPA